MRNAMLWLVVLWTSVLQGRQALDNTGNFYLTGHYFFRWVVYSGLDSNGIRQATAAYGTIQFDGAGTYRIDGRIADSTTSPVTSRPFTPAGNYTVSSSGMAEIENPIFPGDTLYAGAGPAGIVGSSTGHGNHDLFIAIPSPASSVNNGNLAGVFRAATFDFLHGTTGGARDALLSLQADGKGNFAAFDPVGSSADGLAASSGQTVTGATYSLGPDGSGTAVFPVPGGNADARLVAGNKVFFLSADGETFVAGSPTGFDLVVGIRALAGEAANAAYRGLYYTASIQHDIRSTPYHQSLHGARNVLAAGTWYQERINAAPDIPTNHFDGTDTVPQRPFDSDGVYRDTNFYRCVGTGGRIFFEVGRGNFYELYLGVQARVLNGGGSFLSPHGVVSGANFQPVTNPIAPGEIVSLFGSGFATSSISASSVPLPTSLGDVQVKINGRPAPLLFVAPEQINLVVPHATTEPYASVQVFVSGQPLKAAVSYTRATAPGVFTIPPGGAGGGAVLHADYSLVSETSGARPGETVMAFVTGLGAVTPALADGAAAPTTPLSVVPPSAKVSVYVGGIPATVSFAGLAPGLAGVYQINFRIPDNIGAVLPRGNSGAAIAPVEVGTVDGATLTRLMFDPRLAIAMDALAASAANRAPAANPQTVSTNQNTSAFINLTATDLETPASLSTYASHSSAPHGTGSITGGDGLASAVLTFTVVSNPSHGTLTGAAPNLFYTPAPNYTGPDSFEFTATDQGNPDKCGPPDDDCAAPLTSLPATVSITVLPVNTAPAATPQTVAVAANKASVITLAGSDAETPANLLSFAVIAAPAHGTLSGTAPNLTYTPSPDYRGPDSFEFTVTDRGQPDNCGSASTACAAALTSIAGTVSINVGPVNAAPVANPQTLTGAMETPLSFTLTGSDAETAANALLFRVVSQPQEGALMVSGSSVIYTPGSRFHGEDSFSFTVTDRGSPDNCGAAGPACAPPVTSNPAVISISIAGPVPSANTPPQAHPQTVTANENTAKAIVLTGADTETPAAGLAFAVTVNPAHGTLSGAAPNLTYTPAANYIGPDSFRFTVTDRGNPDNCGAPGSACAAALTSSAATVSITVSAVNTPPNAVPQSASTNENTAKAITLSGFDSETAAANLVFAITAAPAHGTLSGTAPNLTYTSNAGYSGPDSFQFAVTDRGSPDNCGAPNSSCAAPLTSGAAIVRLAIIPVNSGPTATPQSFTANQNAAKAVTLAGTDIETPSGSLTFTVTANPAHGRLTGTGPNLTYTPNANYIGPDSFQFTVTDSGKPDNCGVAGDACASALTSGPATVTISVQAVNTAPVANALGAATNENVALPIILSASDAETAPANLSFTVTAIPAHGVLTGAAPNLVYTPIAGFFGVDAFQFKVRDLGNPDNCGAPGSSCAAALESSVATVTITVIPVNTLPAATAQGVNAVKDSATAITLAGTDNETAPANLAFTVTANPTRGTLSGTAPNLTYTPAANYAGPDSFQFTVTDRGKPDNCGAPNPGCSGALTSPAATVSITVAAINSTPIANPLVISTNENTPVPVALTGSDSETAVANLAFTVTTAPSHGTLGGAAPNFLYTPEPGYFGPDGFQFKVTDRGAPDDCGEPNPPACLAALDSALATVSITVVPVNTPPAAAGQVVTTNQDTPASIPIAGTDVESPTLSFVVTSSVAHGTLTGTAPNLTYTPNAGYFGPDSFQFTVTDGGKPDNCGPAGPTCAAARSSAAATVNITVVPVNTAPAAMPQSVNTSESTAKGITLTGSDMETAPANLSFMVTAAPSHGSLTGAAPNLIYTPAAGYFGPDSFQFTVTDRGHPDNCGAAGTACAPALTSSPATVSITVSALNTPPAATSQTVIVNQSASTPVTVAGADVETAAANLSFTITAGPSHGVLTGTAPNLTYTPTGNYAGPDSFQFTVTDRGKPDACGVPGAGCAAALTSTPATVSITVVPVNTAPTASAQSVATAENTVAGITLVGIDPETPADSLSFAITVNPSHGTLTGTAPNLTYTPNANYNGTDSFQFTFTDRGSPDNCGAPGPVCAAAKTSAPAAASITVTPVNSPPVAAGQSVSTNEDTPLPITLSSSDTETSPASLTYTITQPPAHGTLSGSGGNLTYTPAANYHGADSFNFTVTDRGDPDNCGSAGPACVPSLTSTVATVSITINAVNDAPSLGIQAYSAIANMKVVLPAGSLLAGAADPDAADAGFSPVLTVMAGSPVTTPAGGAVLIGVDGSFSFDPPPGVTGNVTFPYQVCDNGNPLPAQCAGGLVTVNVSGPVIWFVAPNLGSNGTGTLASPFNTLASATASAGINANHRIFVYHSANPAAVVSTAPGTAVTLASGQWLAGQSVVAASFDEFMGITPPVTTVARPQVSGATTTIQGTVALNGSDGTVRGVTIRPPAGSRGLVASGSFTGLVVGSGNPGDVSISTNNARGVDLSGGLSGTFVFESVWVSGGMTADNGIVLNNVNNASGSFTVTGDSGSSNNGSGGTIQNTFSHAVSLTNTRNISFDQMNIQAPGDSGVNGTAITNLAFTNGTITNAGDEGYESAIALNGSGSGLGNNINGTLTVTGNTFTNPYYSGLDAQSDSGTVTVAEISNNVIADPGYIGVNLVGTGNAVTSFSLYRATINQNNISSAGTGVQVNIGNSNASGPGAIAGSLATSADIISITNNSITIDPTGTQSIVVANSGGNGASRSRTNFVIRCNGTNTGGCAAPTAGALNGSSFGTVIGIGNNGYSDMTGTVANNVINANHTPNSGGGNGIGGGNGAAGMGNAWTPALTLTVTNNTITGTDGNGILLVGRGTSGFANLKIANNNVSAPINAGGSMRQGIRVDAGNAGSLDDGVCLNIAGNVSAGSNGALGIGVRKQGALADINDFGLYNIPQDLPANDDVATFINGNNTSLGGVTVISGSSYKRCTTAPI